MKRGKFITFEGIDGAGKSTHIDAVAELLGGRGISVLRTREPGGTVLGEKLREILLSDPMHLETEALLMFAARREHLAQLIEPALAQGQWVICDRFSDASHAYQGGGRGLAQEKLDLLEQWVHRDLQPDLTLLFDLPFATAQERIARQGRALDRFEDEKADFHERVRQRYLQRAAAAPSRIRVIDAAQSLPDIKKKVEESVLSICL
ncbi:MAG: dTMP kinase [Betaproteobacteria bacterium]|nr:dTMP kinase [Betaproteobacteria bacterium]